MDARAVLADVARLGPFFAVGTDPDEALDPTWRPVRHLWSEPAPLTDRIGHVRRTLRSDDRAAASIAFQGMAARLVSAPLAAVVLHGMLPRLTADELHWRPSATAPWPLWCPDPDHDPAPGPVDGLTDLLIEGYLRPLVDAVRARVAVSAQVLWGNAASSIASAALVIERQRPGARAVAVAQGVLAAGPLAGTGAFATPRAFRRRSCCLYYRVPDGGLCGDCVLR